MQLPREAEWRPRPAFLINAEAGGRRGYGASHPTNGNAAYIRIRFGGGLPTLPPPVPDVEKRPPPRQMRPAQRPVYDPHAFYPDEEGPEFGA